jgi:TonB family protein
VEFPDERSARRGAAACRIAASLGIVLVLAGCGPAMPAGPPVPDPPVSARHVDPGAFGALSGPDSLVVADTGLEAPRQLVTRETLGRLAPHFPDGLRARGVSGSVVVAFVVDTTGHVVPGTVAVVRADRRDFGLAVCEALPRATYRPAERGGRPRRAVTVQTFTFTVGGDDLPPPHAEPFANAIATMPPAEVVQLLAASPACP